MNPTWHIYRCVASRELSRCVASRESRFTLIGRAMIVRNVRIRGQVERSGDKSQRIKEVRDDPIEAIKSANKRSKQSAIEATDR